MADVLPTIAGGPLFCDLPRQPFEKTSSIYKNGGFQYFWNFHPERSNLTSIFFRWVEKTTN